MAAFQLTRRIAHAAFLVGASLRMLARDGCPLSRWPAEMGKRLALGLPRAERTVWVHGEGVGEFKAAEPVLKWLRSTCPEQRLLLTTSRLQTLSWLQAQHAGALCLPLPWDLPGCLPRFFAHLHPELIVLLEFADGFPVGALLQAQRHGVPAVVINARSLASPKPLRYRLADALRLNALTAPLVERYCVQSAEQLSELSTAGIDSARMVVTGNLKFDAEPAGDSRVVEAVVALLGCTGAEPVLVVGCCEQAEEELVLAAYVAARARHPESRLIIAPQDLGRVPVLLDACARLGLTCQRRSNTSGCKTSVVLLDTLGELAALYELADIVILGGSLTPGGAGHSVLEPAACGKAVVVGPFMSSQKHVFGAFLSQDAVVQVDVRNLTEAIDRLLSDAARRRQIGERARQVVAANRGALARTCGQLEELLPAPPAMTSRRPALVKRCIKSAAASPVGQWLLKAQGRRLHDWADIHARLGRPRTLLCLGNGPSSEDARVGNVPHDCLFRVNSRWRERGWLARPDVVFTGDFQAVRDCPDCLFGFRTIEEETLMLLRRPFRPWRRLEYFTLERLSDVLDEKRWSARPTNGAVMIAAAVALQPERLIIAGIDLFRHPAGCYPGSSLPNQYHPAHDRAVEIAILRRVLTDYRGQLSVIGTLAQALGLPEGRPARTVRLGTAA